MKLLFHVHSKYSCDSLLSPAGIIEFCISHGIDYLAITDHDTIKGSIVAENYTNKNNIPLNIITSAEYSTGIGDIIGVFLKEDIICNEALKLIEEIHRQGGLAVLPHPFHGHNLTDKLIEKIDLIEIFNARCSESENQKAKELAARFNKPVICGADAHVFTDLALCYNYIQSGDIKTSILKIKSFNSKYSTDFNYFKSQLIKSLKKRSVNIFIKTIKSIISKYLIQYSRTKIFTNKTLNFK